MFGMSESDFAELMERQGGACAICGGTDPGVDTKGNRRDWSLDHDHNCEACGGTKGCPECLRGALCNRCNQGLGYLSDDADRLEAGARYLRAYLNKADKRQ